MDLAAAKAALRKDVLARRERISEDEARAFAKRLAMLGAHFVAEQKPASVSAFWSIGTEPSTFPLLESLQRQNVPTALPIIEGRGKPLTFRLWQKGEPLAEAKWGIREPLAQAQEVFPDLLFVPLAAFDRSGNRLGYGAGFYDRTLTRLKSMKPITTVGIAFAIQEVPRVPADETDEKLDFVLTDREWIICK
jgi:5-formyltetrahydrofolate cyclo-ligase